jgi:hypothetical protein
LTGNREWLGPKAMQMEANVRARSAFHALACRFEHDANTRGLPGIASAAQSPAGLSSQ